MLREKLLALLNCSQSLARNSRSLTAVLAEMIRQLEILLPEACGYLVLFLAKDIQPRIMTFGGARSPRNRLLQELLREAASAKGAEVKIIRVDSTLNGPSIKGNRFSVMAPIKGGPVCIGHIVSGFPTAKDAEHATELLKTMSELAGVHIVNAQERESAAARSRYLWQHDALVTNLPNRRLFRKRARKAFAAGLAAVVFLDLDGFKTVNRKFGYSAGDEVLKRIAGRWRRIVKRSCPHATLARVGGDEFVVLLPAAERELAETLAIALITGLRTASEYINTTPMPRASAGVSQSLTKGARFDDVLRRAEVAMFRAKAAGGDRYALARQKLPRMKGEDVHV